MRRIVVIASSMSGVNCATRIKRRLPEDEVNVIVPAELESMGQSSGVAGKRVLLPNLELLLTRRVGVIEAQDIMPDIASREVSVTSDRGNLPVRYSDLVVEIPVQARIPRPLINAENVVPMPLHGFATTAERCDTIISACVSASKPVLVVGNGMHALSAVLLAKESGATVQWLRLQDAEAPWVEPHLAALITQELGSLVTVLHRPHLSAEPLSFRLDDAGTTLLGIDCPDGTTLEGGCCLWAHSLMARHPLLREEGFTLDAFARMQKEEDADPRIFLIGAGAAAPSAVLAKGIVAAPVYAGSDESAAVLSAVTAEEVAGTPVAFPGLLGVHRADMPGFGVYRAGLTMAEAEAAGIAAEHATAVLPCCEGGCAEGEGSLLLTLICHKESGCIIGVQVMGRKTFAATLDGVFGMGLAALTNASTVTELSLREPAGVPGTLMTRCASILRHKLGSIINGITPDELLASDEAGSEFFILDLRSKAEWENRRLPEAYNIPFPQLKKRLQQEVPRNTALVLVCATSTHAFNAACMLADLGATDLFVLDGGMDLWPYPLG